MGMKINFSSWKSVAEAWSESGNAAAGQLASVVSSTTDPAACGSAGGLATIDGAVAIMLSVFGSVMQDTVVTNVTEGIASESQALTDTGKLLLDTEDQNTTTANRIGDSL